MRPSTGTLLFLFFSLFAVCSSAGSAAAAGRVHGVVSDASGGVLPGVTVVATAEGGRVLSTAVTDAAGGFVFAALPAAPITLTFQLEGFADATLEVSVDADADALASPHLTLAPRAETVVVHGAAPAPPPPPPPVPPPPPPPPAVVIPVPEHDRDSICGPAKPDATAAAFGTIRSRRRAAANELYTKGDELTIDGGTRDGLEVGRNFVARRSYRAMGAQGPATAEHSAGLLQIVEAGERASVAVVVYACDELMRGDLLAAFDPEPIRAPEPPGAPAFDNAARILFGDLGQTLGVPRQLMVIDRGRDHGIQAGQRLTLFRRRGSRPPAVVGEAVVVAARHDSATIRVERVTDAISVGDFAAQQRYSSTRTAGDDSLPARP
jgi:hypothetical protein